MCTKLSTKLQRMTLDELAHDYLMGGINIRNKAGNEYARFSLMAVGTYQLKQVMERRFGKDETDAAIKQAREVLAMVGL